MQMLFDIQHVALCESNVLGIGAIPDAVLKQLTGHKELGIHTEYETNSLFDPLIL